mmetsp:Transcript_16999/g.30758  ORF Transcript_16999/g.30758 Transcript_16999/m.30758 type:complete len:183 (+) Transcript_16999:274-822(+)
MFDSITRSNERTKQLAAKEHAMTSPRRQQSTKAKAQQRRPKKSNVTNADAKTTTSSSAPISSLSYDQLVRLHEDTNPSSNNNSTVMQQPASSSSSLRHAVLSLTLALTSNASSWDSNFIKDCNTVAAAVVEHPNHVNIMTGVNKLEHDDLVIIPPMTRHTAKQRWMPRLLRGTRVMLQKEED